MPPGRPRSGLIGCQYPGELAQRLLVALVGDLRKIAGEFEAHPLARADRALALRVEPLKEIADRHTQNLTDFIEPAGGNAIDPALILMGLLIGYADQVG